MAPLGSWACTIHWASSTTFCRVAGLITVGPAGRPRESRLGPPTRATPSARVNPTRFVTLRSPTVSCFLAPPDLPAGPCALWVRWWARGDLAGAADCDTATVLCNCTRDGVWL